MLEYRGLQPLQTHSLQSGAAARRGALEIRGNSRGCRAMAARSADSRRVETGLRQAGQYQPQGPSAYPPKTGQG